MWRTENIIRCDNDIIRINSIISVTDSNNTYIGKLYSIKLKSNTIKMCSIENKVKHKIVEVNQEDIINLTFNNNTYLSSMIQLEKIALIDSTILETGDKVFISIYDDYSKTVTKSIRGLIKKIVSNKIIINDNKIPLYRIKKVVGVEKCKEQLLK